MLRLFSFWQPAGSAAHSHHVYCGVAQVGDVIGQQIQVTVANAGTVDIAAGIFSSIGFYLASDSTITDFLFSGAGIAEGSPEASGFIGFLVDEFCTIAESAETNNTTARQGVRLAWEVL